MLAPLALVLLVLFGSAAMAQTVERVDVLDRGVYAIEAGEATPDANTPTGEVTAVDTAKNIAATTDIKAELGLEFGLHYFIVGQPAGGDVTLDFVILYPEPGLRDPAAAEPLRQSRYSRVKKIGEAIYLGYGFESDWEIVPGTWTFQIWDRDRMLAEQTFTVSR